jgi:CRP-like cAMP-binding protein
MFAVVSGQLKVSVHGAAGREVVLHIAGRGQLVGELATITRRPRSATVTAVGDAETIALTADQFRGFIDTHPRVASLMIEHVAGLIWKADRQIADLATRDVTGRVATRLLALVAEANSDAAGGTRLSLSQDDLAAWTGASREAVAKSLQLLRELGWVKTGRRQITVLDEPALRGLVR